MTPPIRILLVDDHTLLRESLVRFLEAEPGLHIAGHCATIAEALTLLASTPVDLILLDYDLGEEAGTDLLRHLAELKTSIPVAAPVHVLMLTAGMTHAATLSALHAGIAGVVLKQTGTRQLVEAIQRVARGETWLTTETLRSALNTINPTSHTPQSARELTPRQRLVLRAILDGLSNKEIAARLDASETAIKASIQELFTKAGVRTRSQLVRVALERFSSAWLQD